MASMTRNRCVDSFKPGPAQIQYYADRARDGPGIVVSEGILVDWAGLDWPHAPVMISKDHAEAWRAVTNAVHNEGALMFMQAWHAGRCQNDQMPVMKSTGRPVLAPSAIPAKGGKYHALPGHPGHTSNVRAVERPQELIETYRRSATLAKLAGFDGIELLCQGRANKRTDAYGGSIPNRCRFTLELIDALAPIFAGPQHLIVKLSPTDALNDSVVSFTELRETYTYLLTELVKRNVGIINICRRGTDVGTSALEKLSYFARPEGYPLPPGYDPVLDFGGLVKRPGSETLLMANQDYGVEEAARLIGEGKIDLISFGRPFICNPDLVARIRNALPLATNDRSDAVFYGPYKTPDENYNDWPVAVTA